MHAHRLLHLALTTCVRTSARLLPGAAVRLLYRRATAGLGVAVCLHRAAGRARAADPAPEMTARPRAIDDFLDLVAPMHARPNEPLVMSFDDGYADAAEYVATRALRYPAVDWLFFLCPEKTEKQAGYRWDLYARRRREGERIGSYRAFLRDDLAIEHENDRGALRAVAAQPEYRLASLEQCRRLARLPNVTLGNHTDTHFELTLLSEAEVAKELMRSTIRFEGLFGRSLEHFAFPFGGNGQVASSHVTYLRSLRNPVMWTTQGLPFAPANQIAGSVMPRFVFMGTWSPRANALWIAVQSLRHRIWPRDLNDAFGHPAAPAAKVVAAAGSSSGLAAAHAPAPRAPAAAAAAPTPSTAA
jgi:peptidoglycan/xylan/chitin deacetylase (PgdA/CDA1 family)